MSSPSSWAVLVLPVFAPLLLAYGVVSLIVVTTLYIVTRPCPARRAKKSFRQLWRPFFRWPFHGPVGPGTLSSAAHRRQRRTHQSRLQIPIPPNILATVRPGELGVCAADGKAVVLCHDRDVVTCVGNPPLHGTVVIAADDW